MPRYEIKIHWKDKEGLDDKVDLILGNFKDRERVQTFIDDITKQCKYGYTVYIRDKEKDTVEELT